MKPKPRTLRRDTEGEPRISRMARMEKFGTSSVEVRPSARRRGAPVERDLRARFFGGAQVFHPGNAPRKAAFHPRSAPLNSGLIPAFRINGTNGMQSGVHGERARLACRAVRPARHTGRPQAFGTPWVATCIPRGRGIRHARRVRSPNHASLLFQPLCPVSLFLKDRIKTRSHNFLNRSELHPCHP